jgi:hypothetical protein
MPPAPKPTYDSHSMVGLPRTELASRKSMDGSLPARDRGTAAQLTVCHASWLGVCRTLARLCRRHSPWKALAAANRRIVEAIRRYQMQLALPYIP